MILKSFLVQLSSCSVRNSRTEKGGGGKSGTGDWTGSVIKRSQAQHSILMTYECPELFLTVIFETLRVLRFR